MPSTSTEELPVITTFIVTEAVLPFLIAAVITALPALIPVTFPLEETAATSGLELVKVTLWSIREDLTAEEVTVALTVVLAPMLRRFTEAVSLTERSDSSISIPKSPSSDHSWSSAISSLVLPKYFCLSLPPMGSSQVVST